VIENPVGTAPAFIVEDARGTIICLPGVPRELEYLMTERVIPYLKGRLGQASLIRVKVLRTCSIGESQIDSLIGDLMTLSNPRLAWPRTPPDGRAHHGQSASQARPRPSSPRWSRAAGSAGRHDLCRGSESLGAAVARLLVERGATLALVMGSRGRRGRPLARHAARRRIDSRKATGALSPGRGGRRTIA